MFLKSLRECQEILFHHGVITEEQRGDFLENIIERTDLEEYNANILTATLALVGIQIGLVQMLRQAEVPMTHCVGHSIGEVAAAYASNHITLTQTILIAYYRGKALQDSACPLGCMAATGLTWEELKTRLAGYTDLKVWAACHNGVGSTTVSGHPSDVEKFVEGLKKDNIFARIINSSGAAFHSPMMENAVTVFATHLATIFKSTKCVSRLACLKSSSDLESNCLLVNADYFVNNLSDPVRFCEAIGDASETALMLEVGPHALMRTAIRATKPSIKYISLQKKGADALHEVFKQLGNLYVSGVRVCLEKLMISTSIASAGSGSSDAASCGVDNNSVVSIPNSLLYSWDHSAPCFVPSVTLRKEACVESSDPPAAIPIPTTQLTHENVDKDGYTCCVYYDKKSSTTFDRAIDQETKQIVAKQNWFLSGQLPCTLQTLRTMLPHMELDDTSSSHGMLLYVSDHETLTVGLKKSLTFLQQVLVAIERGVAVVHVFIQYNNEDHKASPCREVIAAFWRSCQAELHRKVTIYCTSLDCASDFLPLLKVAMGVVTAGTALFSTYRECVLRDNQIITSCLEKVPSVPHFTIPDSSQGQESARIYRGPHLLVGGAGMLGVQVSKWLIQKGAKQLFIVSRKASQIRTEMDLICRECQSDCIVTLLDRDLTDPSAVSEVSNLAHFTGVFCLSGMLKAMTTQSANLATLTAVLEPKMIAHNLHQDFVKQASQPHLFLMFSSIGVLGWDGGLAYGAANAALDAVAQQRCRLGHRATSIRLGSVNAPNSMADAQTRRWFAARGCGSLEIQDILTCLEALVYETAQSMSTPTVAAGPMVQQPVISLLKVNSEKWNQLRPWDTSFAASTSKVCQMEGVAPTAMPPPPPMTTPTSTQQSNIHASCIIDPSAHIHPTSILGPFTIIGSQVVIEAHCVLASHCSIESGAVIGTGSKIGKWCQVDDHSIIGKHNVLENSVIVTGQTMIGDHNLFYSGINVGSRGEWKSDTKSPSGPVTIGNHNVIRENVAIHRPFSRDETHIGNDCYIMHGVTIAHDVFVDDSVQIAPMCVVAGFCNIFRGAFLGIQSSFHQFTTVGAYSMIGMANRVSRDIPPCTTVVNNECIKLNIHGLQRNHGFSDADIVELDEYFNTEWPSTSATTKTVFKSVMESFVQCRLLHSSKRSIAPLLFVHTNPYDRASGPLDASTGNDLSRSPNKKTIAIKNNPSNSSNNNASDHHTDTGVEISAIITRCLCETLHLPPSSPRHDSQLLHSEFEDLGLDSLVAVSFAAAVSRQLRVAVSEQDLATHNTVHSLTTFVLAATC